MQVCRPRGAWCCFLYFSSGASSASKSIPEDAQRCYRLMARRPKLRILWLDFRSVPQAQTLPNKVEAKERFEMIKNHAQQSMKMHDFVSNIIPVHTRYCRLMFEANKKKGRIHCSIHYSFHGPHVARAYMRCPRLPSICVLLCSCRLVCLRTSKWRG